MPYIRLKLKFRDKFIRSTHKATMYYHVIDEDRSHILMNPSGEARYQLFTLCGKSTPPKFQFFFDPPQATNKCRGCSLTPEQLAANAEWRKSNAEWLKRQDRGFHQANHPPF